jgi:hypothetical protein
MSTNASELVLEPYVAEHEAGWEALVEAAPMATLLHTRRYLSYHAHRFDDRSLVALDGRGRIVAVFPAALDPADPGTVVSHPGITYGGIVHDGAIAGARAVALVADLCAAYRAQGCASLVYKAVPAIYHRRPSADDVYALVRNGGRLSRCDLSTAIDLGERGPRSERRRRGARKAERANLVVGSGHDALPDLWAVLAENLAARHDARPTHTLEEIQLLAGRFPDAIQVVAAFLGEELVAGVVLFVTPRVVHTQYIASSPRGREVAALDLVLERCIEHAAEAGARWFDFGISTTDAGRTLNDDLYRFKAEFGGGGIVHAFFEVALNG